MDLLVERCAGLDVAKQEVVACVRTPEPGAGGQRRQAIRTFATFSAELEALADWLAAEGVTQVVMEATGQYWKPIVRHEAPSDRAEVQGLRHLAVAAAG
jgi:transposase